MNQIEVLRQLVLSERILLHGSPNRFHEIHPQYTDEEMAICATPYPELAIIMAILKSCGSGYHGYTVSIRNGKAGIKVRICERKLERLLQGNIEGYVYAFDHSGFKKIDPIEYRRYESAYSTIRLTVNKEHLPFIPLEGQTEYSIGLNLAVANLFN